MVQRGSASFQEDLESIMTSDLLMGSTGVTNFSQTEEYDMAIESESLVVM